MIAILLLLISPVFAGQGLDPTKPLIGTSTKITKVEKSTLVLQSIIAREQSRKAIINGKTLIVGDRIGLYELISIDAHGVVLSSPQRELKLSLFSTAVTNSK